MQIENYHKNKNWILQENKFDIQHQGKCESTMHLANGYLGLRSAFEETYPYQTRGMFAAGTFNRSNGDTTELPNAADTCGMDIFLDEEPFSMSTGEIKNYNRSLNLYTGELVRSLTWKSHAKRDYELVFRRFVSNTDVHSYGIQIRIKPLTSDSSVRICTGINARMTNSGAQHFVDGMKRVIERRYLFLSQSTTESGIIFAHGCCCDIRNAGDISVDFEMERRLLTAKYDFKANKGESAVLDKICTLYTSNDFEQIDDDQLLDILVDHMKMQSQRGYDALRDENCEWYKKFWEKNDIIIEAVEDKIQLAARYAQFCLQAMMPVNSRASIAAKGLSGEGYKGHVFWDTEIFIMPYFLHTDPNKARRLLDYRLSKLEQARRNALKNGYRGIMFPWESAATGEEETPKFASMNILTGKAARVWAGDKEHHITADIAVAAYKYWKATGDKDFLEKGGAFLIIGCALFWVSRAYFNKDKDCFEILDIIGPDEYTEHIDNNAYTNYMVCAAVKNALEIWNLMPDDMRKSISIKLDEQDIESVLKDFRDKIYLPEPDTNGVIPQDDTFMGKAVIDVAKYRIHNTKQTILKDYSRSQVNDMQVLKQADVIMLLYVLRDRFGKEAKKRNLFYYEPKTIHDSSLSRAIHALAACDCDETNFAYDQFLNAIDIDIGDNPVSSDAGIHAASMGGIWLDIVEGFAGVYLIDGQLNVDPKLPETIKSICFRYQWGDCELLINVIGSAVRISCNNDAKKEVNVAGRRYSFTRDFSVSL
jgi:hypothetical glycosyl hydrolase